MSSRAWHEGSARRRPILVALPTSSSTPLFQLNKAMNSAHQQDSATNRHVLVSSDSLSGQSCFDADTETMASSDEDDADYILPSLNSRTTPSRNALFPTNRQQQQEALDKRHINRKRTSAAIWDDEGSTNASSDLVSFASGSGNDSSIDWLSALAPPSTETLRQAPERQTVVGIFRAAPDQDRNSHTEWEQWQEALTNRTLRPADPVLSSQQQHGKAARSRSRCAGMNSLVAIGAVVSVVQKPIHPAEHSSEPCDALPKGGTHSIIPVVVPPENPSRSTIQHRDREQKRGKFRRPAMQAISAVQ